MSAPCATPPADEERTSRGERFRVLVFAAIGPLIAGYAVLGALLALVVAIAPGSGISAGGILAATGPAWLAALHVPLIIAGHPLGMLPLLPTVLLVFLAARASIGAADRLGASTPRSTVPIFLAVGIGHAAFGVFLSLVGSGSQVMSSPVLAFLFGVLFAGVGTAIGLSGRCGLRSALLATADEPTRAGLRAGVLGLIGLLAAGAVLLALALVLSWSTVATMFLVNAPGFGGGLGMLLLSLAYLPNVLVGALSFAVGPGFSIGALVVRPLAFHPGPVPGLPLLGAVPAQSGPWWVVVLLLPASIGVGVGWSCRRVADPVSARSRRADEQPRSDRALGRLRSVGVAALVVGLGCLVLAAFAGGTVAAGPFNPVTVAAGLLALSALGWVGVVGAITALFAGQHPQVLVSLTDRVVDALSDPDEDEVPDPDEDEDPDPDEDEAAEPVEQEPEERSEEGEPVE